MQASLELAYEFMTLADYVALAADVACHVALAGTWATLLLHYFAARRRPDPAHPVVELLSPDNNSGTLTVQVMSRSRPNFRIENDIFEEGDFMTSQ